MKAEHISIALTLEQIPNVGASTASLLREAGIVTPGELVGVDPVWLYDKICQLTRRTHDQRLLCILFAATDFAKGNAPQHWSRFQAETVQASIRSGSKQ